MQALQDIRLEEPLCHTTSAFYYESNFGTRLHKIIVKLTALEQYNVIKFK